MSRLSRLRSFWRSQRRAPIRDGIYRPHAAVNLLPQEYRDGGGLRPDGSWVLSASTGTKERGTRTPGMAITAGFSSSSPLGEVWEERYGQTVPLYANSSTAPRWSIYATDRPGASGAPRGPAV